MKFFPTKIDINMGEIEENKGSEENKMTRQVGYQILVTLVRVSSLVVTAGDQSTDGEQQTDGQQTS